jgi:hypothetical protein
MVLDYIGRFQGLASYFIHVNLLVTLKIVAAFSSETLEQAYDRLPYEQRPL